MVVWLAACWSANCRRSCSSRAAYSWRKASCCLTCDWNCSFAASTSRNLFCSSSSAWCCRDSCVRHSSSNFWSSAIFCVSFRVSSRDVPTSAARFRASSFSLRSNFASNCALCSSFSPSARRSTSENCRSRSWNASSNNARSCSACASCARSSVTSSSPARRGHRGSRSCSSLQPGVPWSAAALFRVSSMYSNSAFFSTAHFSSVAAKRFLSATQSPSFCSYSRNRVSYLPRVTAKSAIASSYKDFQCWVGVSSGDRRG
mmetsp:Transcript_2360/g.5529  ORF Transcript_2360/g.5529 Transcript_2360/m.5529 type:complete len:259 (-) Transcript_2360:292-1068(-)